MEQPAIGAFLRQARDGVGLSLDAMAQRVSVSRSHLSNIENGRRNPPKELIDDIIEVVRQENMQRRSMLGILASIPIGAQVINDPATAEQVLGYAIHLGDSGHGSETKVWHELAISLADWSGDRDVMAYVRARVAVRAFWEGWTDDQVLGAVHVARTLSRTRRVLVECLAATVQLNVRDANYPQASATAERMVDLAESGRELVRAVAFDNYVHGVLGDARSADKAFGRAAPVLVYGDRPLYAEAFGYHALAMVRAGDVAGGVAEATQAALVLERPVRNVRRAIARTASAAGRAGQGLLEYAYLPGSADLGLAAH